MTEEKKQYYTKLINKVIRILNKKKGTNFKLEKINFVLGIDYNSPDPKQLSDGMTITIKDTVSKKQMRLGYYESYFNPEIPDNRDERAGVNRVSDPADKILLRVAFGIWANRHHMYLPKKNKK